MNGAPWGLVLGPALFSIVDSIIDSGICTLSKSADNTKLCGAVDTVKGRDAIQRDLDTLEKGAYVNFLKFNKAECWVLDSAEGNPKHTYRLGREWILCSPEKKDLNTCTTLKKTRSTVQFQPLLFAFCGIHPIACIYRTSQFYLLFLHNFTIFLLLNGTTIRLQGDCKQ